LKISHILVRHKHEAEDIQKLLSEGAEFEEIAGRRSECSSARVGGSLGELSGKKVDEDFQEAMESLKVGEVSGIVRTRFGYHLIRRDS